MFRRKTRLRVPALVLASLTALLVFAAAASAQTRTGESTSVQYFGAPPLETAIVKASASYETNAGSVNLAVRTGEEPSASKGPAGGQLTALLFATPECNNKVLGSLTGFPVPAVAILSSYSEPSSAGAALVLNVEKEPTTLAPVAKTVAGIDTTFAVTSPEFASQDFNCVLVTIAGGEIKETLDSFVVFPLVAKAEPAPPAPASPPTPTPAPATAPAPPVLAIAKPKPLSLKVGKSKIVKIKVSNTGVTATAPGSLKVKAPKGVFVKPGKQQVPALLPGRSFTLSIRVELTEKAKEKSTLLLSGTASGVTAKSSLVVKRTE